MAESITEGTLKQFSKRTPLIHFFVLVSAGMLMLLQRSGISWNRMRK